MHLARLATALAAMTCACPASARDEPLWEAGVGIAGLHFPDYRGSSHTRNYVLPTPYFIYRGDILPERKEPQPAAAEPTAAAD